MRNCCEWNRLKYKHPVNDQLQDGALVYFYSCGSSRTFGQSTASSTLGHGRSLRGCGRSNCVKPYPCNHEVYLPKGIKVDAILPWPMSMQKDGLNQ